MVSTGPQLEQLKRKYPEVVSTGSNFGADLVAYYTIGDVFVFPSLTDTFRLVMLETMASSLPVAAFPVIEPFEVLSGAKAVDQALQAPAKQVRRHTEKYSWNACTDQCLADLVHTSYRSFCQCARLISGFFVTPT